MIYVIAHAHYNHDCCEFVCQGLVKKEDAENLILFLLRRKDSEGKLIFNNSDIKIVVGLEVNVTFKEVEIEKVLGKTEGGIDK